MRRLHLALLVLPFAALQASCGNDAELVLGDTCARDDQCLSNRCDELVCKSSSPAGSDEPCTHSLECRSEQCVTTDSGPRCVTGTRLAGSSCSDDLQCASGLCFEGACVAVATDGSVPDQETGPDAGADAADDAIVDGAVFDVTRDVDLAQSQGDVLADTSPDSAGAPALLLRLMTSSEAPRAFTPSATKAGLLLRWDLGDGTIVDANTIDHTYTLAGTKAVRLYSLDGHAGLTGLDLSANHLTGSIPAGLGELTSLAHLSLSSNDLVGDIPVELGQLVNLTYLSLSGNGLATIIPAELGQLKKLTELYLNLNELTGSIPPELGQLTNLVVLDISWNNVLSGSIPAEIGQLIKLTHLHLYLNQLSGAIPATLSQLINLTELFLYGNRLTGSIPPELGQLTNLTKLNLSNNQLSGSIPAELGQLTNLAELKLGSNQLSGSIPPELGQLSNLTSLSLSSNQLTGSIPAELRQLSELRNVSLAENQLRGSTSGAFSGLLAIEAIYLRNNLLDQAALNAIIDDIYQDRDLHTFPGIKYLSLDGTNGQPSAAARQQVNTLTASYGWTISCNGCN